MNTSRLPRLFFAFIAAVVVATVWGAIVQTQFNLNALGNIGADITPGVRTSTTLGDIFSGFSPTYGGYVVLPSLLVAFAVAWFISQLQPHYTMLWFAAAGTVAVLLGNPVVNFLSPLALLVGATRDLACLVWMALGGTAAGVVFVSLARDAMPFLHQVPAYQREA
jgi:hypothetical protein